MAVKDSTKTDRPPARKKGKRSGGAASVGSGLDQDRDLTVLGHDGRILTTEDITTPTALGSAITVGTLGGIVGGPIGALAGTVAGGLLGAALNRWGERRSLRASAPRSAR